MEHDAGLEDWERELLRGVLSYERIRIGFMAQAEDALSEASFSDTNWGVFTMSVDIPDLLQRLGTGACLGPELCRKSTIALSRTGTGLARGFALTEQSMERLRRHDPEMQAALGAAGTN